MDTAFVETVNVEEVFAHSDLRATGSSATRQPRCNGMANEAAHCRNVDEDTKVARETKAPVVQLTVAIDEDYLGVGVSKGRAGECIQACSTQACLRD